MENKKITVLLVDDDSDDIQVIAEGLSNEDPSIRVIETDNGSEALKYLETVDHFPDLIILDINMPVLDGRKTVAALKKHDRFGSIPVVILTTSSGQVDKTYFEQLNVQMLTKPWDSKQVQDVVQKLLKLARQENE